MTPKQFEDKVMEVENVRIVVRADGKAKLGEYTYQNMAADKLTIKDWLDNRIWPLTNGFDVVIMNGKANPNIRRSTTMGNLRATYSAK